MQPREEQVKRNVSDTDLIRRQNRGLVLDTIRHQGALPRTRIAIETGLSNATISAISSDMVAQNILRDLPGETPDAKSRGRPPVLLGFNRTAGYVLLIEIDVNKARCSLVDYGGTLVDRIEIALTPTTFSEQNPALFLLGRVIQMHDRNAAETKKLVRVAISVQGILDRDGRSLKWSPVQHLAGHNLAHAIEQRYQLPVAIFKRGQLLAEGSRWLYPDLRHANIATVFVGSTIAMGMSVYDPDVPRGHDIATEFGHMNHIPDGALCRCGMHGCIEAYAADYGVLRSTYGVPEKTPPAAAVPPAQYETLITDARNGNHNAIHAFNLAGRAIGFGLNRLMTVFDPSHIVIIGPGANAFQLMRTEIEAALSASLITSVYGLPEIVAHQDESEPIFKGLMMKTLIELDQTDFAALPSGMLKAKAS